jgi:hypothetical protein
MTIVYAGITLVQMITIKGLVKVLTAWVYFNPGWLKRNWCKGIWIHAKR